MLQPGGGSRKAGWSWQKWAHGEQQGWDCEEEESTHHVRGFVMQQTSASLLSHFPTPAPFPPHTLSDLLAPHLVSGMCLVTQSCQILCDPIDWSPPGSSVHGDSPGKNTGVGCHAFLQGIFLTLGLNPGILPCRHILYHLSHKGSPRILK